MNSILSTIGIVGSAGYAAALLWLFGGRIGEIAQMPPNHIGDLLAGAVGPIAIFWLILGFFQQGIELRENARALDLQARELKSTGDEQRALVAAMRAQLQAERDDVALRREHYARMEHPPDGATASAASQGDIAASPALHDMLVRLYALPPLEPALAAAAAHGFAVHRAPASERAQVLDFVRAHFPTSAAEVEVAFGNSPVTCFIASRDGNIAGFACHDATAPNYFGPEGVRADLRGQGVGRALLLASLHAQRAQGYAYAIIGGVGPAAFYATTVGAVPIAGSTPGIYGERLRPPTGPGGASPAPPSQTA